MQKFTFAQKAQKIIDYNDKIALLRAIFNTADEDFDTIELGKIGTNDAVMYYLTVAPIDENGNADPKIIKAWINVYMPIMITRRNSLEDEINQFDQELNR